jgi:DNA repair protein RadC
MVFEWYPGIPVPDHVIVGDGAFFRFREEAGW